MSQQCALGNPAEFSMGNVISQTVVFPVPAETLFQLYLDPTEHEAITGSSVKIAINPGAEFSAFDGALSGKILAIAAPPNRAILAIDRIQTGRSRLNACSKLHLTERRRTD